MCNRLRACQRHPREGKKQHRNSIKIQVRSCRDPIRIGEARSFPQLSNSYRKVGNRQKELRNSKLRSEKDQSDGRNKNNQIRGRGAQLSIKKETFDNRENWVADQRGTAIEGKKRNATIFDEKRHEIELFRTLKFVKLNIVVDNGNWQKNSNLLEKRRKNKRINWIHIKGKWVVEDIRR